MPETNLHDTTPQWTGSMNRGATAVRNQCPSARATAGVDAPIGPATYGRMFPELPSFQADEEFLHALGRAGGLCDCRDIDDSPDSLGDSAAGWTIFGQFVAHDILHTQRIGTATLRFVTAIN